MLQPSHVSANGLWNPSSDYDDHAMNLHTSAYTNDGNLTIKSLHDNEIVSAVVDLKILCLFELNRDRGFADLPAEWHFNVICHGVEHRAMRRAADQQGMAHTISSYENIAQVPHSILAPCKGEHAVLFATLKLGSGANATDDVEIHVNADTLSTLYILFSSISVLCGCLLCWWYIRYPVLRRFPSNIVFWRTLANLVFSFQLVVTNGFELSDNVADLACHWSLAFLTQFCILSSLAWYFVLAVNFYFSISNPFRRPQSKMPAYHAWVWISAAVTGAITATRSDFRPDFQLCWNRREEGINVLNWASYFAWLAVFSLAAMCILLYGRMKLKDTSLQATLKMREESLRQTRIYVLVFTSYWIIAAAIWFAVYFLSQQAQNDYRIDPSKTTQISTKMIQEQALSYFFALTAGSMGMVDCAAWIHIQWANLKSVLFASPVVAMPRVTRSVTKALINQSPASYQSDEGKQARTTIDSVPSLSRKSSEEALPLPPPPPPPTPGDEFDDISDALRHEFILTTSMAIESATKLSLHDNNSNSNGQARDEQMSAPLMDSHRRQQNQQDHDMFMDVALPHIGASTQDYAFKTYRPRLFHRLRTQSFRISDEEFCRSIAGDPKKMKKNFSEGASGSFFYFTVDQVYMVKTLSSEEYLFLTRYLPSYAAYMHENPKSLICRFFGMYSIKMYGHTEYFVVMNNVLRVPGGMYKVDEVYDIKGSKINRHAKPKKKKGKVSVFKDNDMKKTLRMGRAQATELFSQLERDSRFMAEHNIMDYSLLIGIHNCTEPRHTGVHCGTKPLDPFANSTSTGNGDFLSSPPLSPQQPASPSSPSPTMAAAVESRREMKSDTSSSSSSSRGIAGITDPSAIALAQLTSSNNNSPRSSAGVTTSSSPARDSTPASSSNDSHSHVHGNGTGDVAVVMDSKLQAIIDEEEEAENVLLRRGANPMEGGIQASVIIGPGIYYVGIIDVLQEWDCNKKMERWMKMIFKCLCFTWRDLSAVEPRYYSERWLQFVSTLFEKY